MQITGVNDEHRQNREGLFPTDNGRQGPDHVHSDIPDPEGEREHGVHEFDVEEKITNIYDTGFTNIE